MALDFFLFFFIYNLYLHATLLLNNWAPRLELSNDLQKHVVLSVRRLGESEHSGVRDSPNYLVVSQPYHQLIKHFMTQIAIVSLSYRVAILLIWHSTQSYTQLLHQGLLHSEM